jgi:hypothetical protein
MQQCGPWLLRHAAVAVGHSRDRALEKAKHGSHSLAPVERGHEMHFQRAGIAETDFTTTQSRCRTILKMYDPLAEP